MKFKLFVFNGKIFIIDGIGYWVFDGKNINQVKPFIPVVK